MREGRDMGEPQPLTPAEWVALDQRVHLARIQSRSWVARFGLYAERIQLIARLYVSSVHLRERVFELERELQQRPPKV